jgi:hypothetical protein
VNLQTLAPDDFPLERRAALTLHALKRSDRAWLLAQLPSFQRERLEYMLEELAELRIPADHKLIDHVIGATAAKPAQPPAVKVNPEPAAPTGLAQRQAALSRLDAGAVVKVLHDEPAGVIAAALDVRAWPWRDAVLSQVGTSKRRHVERLLEALTKRAAASAPEALHNTLIQALYSRLAVVGDVAHPAAAKADARSGRPRRWTAGLPQWVRRASERT